MKHIQNEYNLIPYHVKFYFHRTEEESLPF